MDRQGIAATGSVPGDPRAEGAQAWEDLDQLRLFVRALRHAAIGMALVSAEGGFLEVNTALCRMLGHDEATLRLIGLRDVTHPDDLPEILELVEELVAGRREDFERERRYIHADGHLIWAQLAVSCLRNGGQCLLIVQIVAIREAQPKRLALAEQEEHNRQLAENADDVACRLDPEGRIIWLSPSVEPCLGWQPEQLLNQGLEAVIHPLDQPKLLELLDRSHASVLLKLRLRCAHGAWLWMSMKARQVNNSAGDWTGWISGWRDIQAEVEMREQLDQALHTDALTGLASRSVMLERINGALANGKKLTTTAVLSVGVDRLSQVNHALTHRAGDLLIATVARRLVTSLKQPEQVARGMGDSFIVLLDQLASPEEAGVIAERLRLASKGPIRYETQTIEPSVSIGLAIAQHDPGSEPGNGPTADDLLRDASLAMCEAATLGRDRCECADPQLTARAQQSLRLLQELRQGLETGELQAWFMPMVNLSDDSLWGYEALVRWPRPDGRVEMPDTFLPVARSGQMAEEIDLLMLRQSIAALAELPPPLSVAANLSAEILARPDLVEQVQQWLQAAGVSPHRLHLEITETSLLKLGTVKETIRGLAELGVRWLVDDFGTGFSSISHLRDLPIHGLKLDRSFTEGLRHGDQKSVRLAQALAGLAEGLGLETVAEGIESAEEAVCLRNLGWSYGQGWYFGKAAPLSHWQNTPVPLVGPSTPPAASPLGSSTRSWALAVTDNVPVGLFALRFDPQGNPHVLFVSRRWLEMLQLERNQIMADVSSILERLHPDDRAALITSSQTHLAQGTPLSWEGRLQSRQVTTWVLLEATPLRQADGTCIWQGVISDITDRKRQELHLRRLLDEAPIAMAINDLRGDDPRITYVNQQFIRSFGYDLGTIPNLSDWARLAYPDRRQRETLFQAWDAGVARARQSTGVVAPIEAQVTAADGRVHDALFSAVVLGDELVLSVLDITEWRQAERKLQEARASLAENALAITEAIPVGTYTMVQPPDGVLASFAFMSERFLQMSGLKREEAAADPLKVFACVHPDDYDAWVQRHAEAFARKQPFAGECRVLVGGEVRWVRAESVPRELADGSTVWEGVLMDISDQQQALEQLAQERSLLNAVLTHIDAHVYMKNRQGRYLYANANAMQYLNDGLESIVGYTNAELLAPEAAQAIQEFDEQVFSTGGPLWREEHLPLPNGAERVFLSKKLLYRQPGQEDCLIGFSTDITELRQATKQLAASEEHFRLLAENSSDVVFRLDSAGRIVWVSPSLTTALGWLPEEWIGQIGTKFLVHGGEAERYKANLQTLQNNGRRVIAREQIYAKDGSLYWIETHAGPYVNSKGIVEGAVASFRLIDEMVQAEETLRLSEQRHRRLADQMLDVVWAINLEGQFTYFSPSLQRVRGFMPEELMATPLEQQFTPDSYAIVLDGLRQAREDVAAGRPVNFHAEVEEYCKDGSTVWTDVKATSLYDEKGEFLEIAGVSRDITLQHQLREELRISEECHRRLADQMLDVVWAITLDGQLTYLSPSVQQLRGFSPEEIMALPLNQTLTPASYALVAEGLSKARDDVAAGRPVVFHAELEEYCKDGSTVWTDAKATSIFAKDGNFLEIVGITRDITIQRQLREELRISEERYRLLAENARDVIWTMERDGRISYVSPSIQLLRGFTPEEAMQQTLQEILTPESQQRSQSYFLQMLADLEAGRVPQPFRGELEYYCRDGSTIWTEVMALPTFDSQGQFQKLLGVSRSISERKYYEQQLTAVNQQLQALATTDGLTGIWNRRHLEATIQQAMVHSDRYGEALSLILCDVDDFKDINDHFGHPVGDQVLIAFCQRLRKQLRSSDGLGRWGGEEFLILLDHTDAQTARALADKLKQLIVGSPFSVAGTVTASFGVAQRRGQESFADWLLRVDNRLYAAKKAGRNCVVGD
ncbi:MULTISPECIES: PAS domain S-box protein [unclassified Cyanobium]|uniref:PAS domain S-box protein n=1 Tax=unclassified Cyanobium TaxID=2627006 RepID=UPI0020CBB296|nr:MULTISPECIES: PAS domain S-box protein [unclassified Cyanobium]